MAALGRLLRLTPSSTIKPRSFAAAAAQQLDEYDFYERHYNMADGEGSEPKRGIQWVIIGDPGANKHVYAQRLSNLLQVPHISLASLVRQQLHPRSSLYKQIESTVSKGMLVPEDIIFGLLSKKLEEGHFRGEAGFILEGIPRTRKQAEILDQIVDIDLVLNLRCTERELVDTTLQSGLNLQLQGSQIQSSLEGDWKEKLRTHVEQNKALEDYYRKEKKLLDFQVAEGLGETWKGLLSVLQLQHMDSCFQKLRS